MERMEREKVPTTTPAASRASALDRGRDSARAEELECGNERTDELFDQVRERLGDVMERRKDGVNHLRDQLLEDGGRAVLGAGPLTMGVTGALVSVTRKLSDALVADLASRVGGGPVWLVQASLGGVVAQAMGAAVPSLVAALAGPLSCAGFVKVHRQAIDRGYGAARDVAYGRRAEIMAGPTPGRDLALWRDQLAAQADVAEREQYVASATAWCRLVELATRGAAALDPDAPDAPGVVDIEVDLPAADAERMVVTGARLEGVPQALANTLAQDPELTLRGLAGGNSGLTVRVRQSGSGGLLMGQVGHRRTRLALESAPGARGTLTPPLTGDPARFLLERANHVHGMELDVENPALAQVAAAVVWEREVLDLRLAELPGLVR